jgi:hypothetical protein
VVCGRGTQSILRARGRWLAWSAGPSTSPLERIRETPGTLKTEIDRDLGAAGVKRASAQASIGGSLCARSLSAVGASGERRGARPAASQIAAQNVASFDARAARLTQCGLRLRSACGVCASRAQCHPWVRSNNRWRGP